MIKRVARVPSARFYEGDWSDALDKAQREASNDGALLELPAGTIDLKRPFVIGKPLRIEGEGPGTMVRPLSPQSDAFTIDAQQCVVAGVKFASAGGRRAAPYVSFTANAHRSTLQEFSMFDAAVGVALNGAVTQTIRQGQIFNSLARTGTAIKINNGLDISISDIIVDAPEQIFAGVHITASGDVHISDCQLLHAGNAVFADAGKGAVIASLWVSDSFLDQGVNGLALITRGGSIVRVRLDTVWISGNAESGVVAVGGGGGSVMGLHASNVETSLNGHHGVTLSGAVSGVQWNSATAAGNRGAAWAVEGAGVADWHISSPDFGDTDGLGPNQWGVKIARGASAGWGITGGRIEGNSAGNLVDETPDDAGKSVIGVRGVPTVAAGTATIGGGADFIEVSHGLSRPPGAGQIQVTAMSPVAGGYWIEMTGPDRFAIRLDAPAGEAVSFGWKAAILGA